MRGQRKRLTRDERIRRSERRQRRGRDSVAKREDSEFKAREARIYHESMQKIRKVMGLG